MSRSNFTEIDIRAVLGEMSLDTKNDFDFP